MNRNILIGIVAALVFLLGGVLGAFTHSYFKPWPKLDPSAISITTTRDTIRVPVPYPVVIQTVRVDTVPAMTYSDIAQIDERGATGTDTPTTPTTDDRPAILPSGDITVPIERRTYETADYRAVIEGWRPKLLSMEVYPEKTTITQTIREKPVFSLSVGPGLNWNGKEVKAGVQVTAGFVLWSR